MKRDKLLSRKYSLAHSIKTKEQTLQEIEDLVEKSIFTADEMKCMLFLSYLLYNII